MDRSAAAYFVTVRKAGEKGEAVDLSDKVLSLDFDDTERKADKLTLSINNFDLTEFDDPIWAHGNIIQFAFGWESALGPVREAVIRSVKGGRILQIEAHAKSVLLDRIKRRESFGNKTRSEIVTIIAKRNGYAKDTLKIDRTTERFEIITQPNLTDAQMLRKLAHLEGFEFFVDFDGLHWHVRDLSQAPIRKFTYYTDPGQGDVLDFNIENDITRKPGRVRVKSRDPLTKKSISAVADNESDKDRDVLQETKALEEFILEVDPETGAVTNSVRPLAQSQTTAYEQDVSSNVQTEGDAKAEAKRIFRKASQRAVKMTLNIIGDANVVAKSVVEVTGMGTPLSGKYYVKGTQSSVSGDGSFVMTLKLITDGYQRRYGSGKGSKKTESATGALSQALAEIESQAQLVTDARILGGVAQALEIGRALVSSGSPSKVGLSKLAKGLGRLSQVSQETAGKSSGSEKSALTELSKRLAKTATLARRLANQEDVEAKGKLNTKGVGDSRDLQQRVTVDSETGAVSTTYVEARARGRS